MELIDFANPELTYKRKHSINSLLLAKAINIKKHSNIIDATAGMGTDSFFLACLGCNVTLLERNPIMFQALADGIKSARQDPELTEIISRMQIINVDSINYFQTHMAEVIYLDPMFPEKNNAAKSRQTMQTLRDIVGDDNDAAQLLSAALQSCTKRVVVKRPRNAPIIGDKKPSHQLSGKAGRFDVYQK